MNETPSSTASMVATSRDRWARIPRVATRAMGPGRQRGGDGRGRAGGSERPEPGPDAAGAGSDSAVMRHAVCPPAAPATPRSGARRAPDLSDAGAGGCGGWP
jgi:hypothetical protein